MFCAMKRDLCCTGCGAGIFMSSPTKQAPGKVLIQPTSDNEPKTLYLEIMMGL